MRGSKTHSRAGWLAPAMVSLCFLLTNKVNAQETGTRLRAKDLSPLTAEGVSTLEMPEFEDVRTQYYGQVRLEGMDYLTPLKEAPQLTYSQFLSARLSLLREGPRMDYAADISAGTFFYKYQSNIFVNEAYASYKTAPAQIFVGRKKVEWSELDHRWQLGLWQPKQAIDTLRPEEQGLIGLFVDHSTDNFELIGLASPINIPNMNPDVRNEDGHLISDSRWYRSPTGKYNFNNRINSIAYKLDLSDTERLAMHSGAAVSTRLGRKAKGPWVVSSLGYMPVNDLILRRKIFKAAAADRVDVTVTPEETNHTVGSIDLGYSYEDVRFVLSYLEDKPNVQRPDPDWAIQNIMPIKAYSAGLDFSLDNIIGSRSLAIKLGYLKIVGGEIIDVLADGTQDDLTLFDQRMKFTNSVSTQVEGQLGRIFKRPLVTRFKYVYDYDQKGSLINTEFLYYPSQKWALVTGADILSVDDENYKPTSFLNQFRANDRVYGGMTYVF